MPLTPDKLASFPNLVPGRFDETSQESDGYNCIAWAAEDTTRPWWPTRGYHWPRQARYEETLIAFVSVFQLLGYEPCDTDVLEEGFLNVAIFSKTNGTQTHAARQLPSGRWISKLGTW